MLEALLSGAAKADSDFGTVAIRMPKSLHARLKDLCDKHGLSLQSVGLHLLESAAAELSALPVKAKDAASDTATADKPAADKPRKGK